MTRELILRFFALHRANAGKESGTYEGPMYRFLNKVRGGSVSVPPMVCQTGGTKADRPQALQAQDACSSVSHAMWLAVARLLLHK